MPRIPQNLRKHAIGMLNPGMRMNVVDMNIVSSTHAIRHLRQLFHATGHTEDRPRSGHLHVTIPGQDCYILNTQLCNRFQTATATAANTHGTHISAQTVCNCLHKAGLSGHHPYFGCVLVQHHRVNRVNTYQTLA